MRDLREREIVDKLVIACSLHGKLSEKAYLRCLDSMTIQMNRLRHPTPGWIANHMWRKLDDVIPRRDPKP